MLGLPGMVLDCILGCPIAVRVRAYKSIAARVPLKLLNMIATLPYLASFLRYRGVLQSTYDVTLHNDLLNNL